MTRVAPVTIEDLPPETREAMDFARETMGFTSNDVLAIARWPELLSALRTLVGVIYSSEAIDAGLKRMIGMVASSAAGCRYCHAHAAHGAVRMTGAATGKIEAVWEYRTSPLFDDAERAALDLALAAGRQPNAATDEHFEALREHFSERQIVEIVATIALFGFLNRWNDTLATALEDAPLDFAREHLAPGGWKAGRHAGEG